MGKSLINQTSEIKTGSSMNLEDFSLAAYCGNNITRPGYCPEIFDTLLCWPETASGTTANQSCPSDYAYDPRKQAFKECTENGTWYVNPESGRLWTNYTTCVDHTDLAFRMHINELFVIGYSVSLAALVISLAIFFVFRTLRCTRIRIHIQLFTAFAFHNFLWIIWYELVVPDPTVTLQNKLWCQALHIILHYFMLANYLWMFCEALHLHLALVVVFVRDEVTMKWFLALGWGAPLLIIATNAIVRIFVLHDNEMCWMKESFSSSWILSGPVCVSLLLSFISLINVLRVILTISHPNAANPAPLGIRRAARAALILIPLFGLQHILIPFRPADDDSYEHLYQYITVFVTTPQGLLVSCLFCFANQDVHQAIRSFMHRRSTRWGNYHYTGAVDSAGVYVVNGSSQCNPGISLKRKTTSTTVRL